VNRSGTLTATSRGGTTGAPLDDALLAELTGSRTVTQLMRRPAVERVVDGIGETLVRRGLLVAPGRAVRARRLAPILLYVVFAVGVVRWINGAGNHLPVGYLTFLLAVTLCGGGSSCGGGGCGGGSS
jgi:uncharacterized protein (TIGR04222 family)